MYWYLLNLLSYKIYGRSKKIYLICNDVERIELDVENLQVFLLLKRGTVGAHKQYLSGKKFANFSTVFSRIFCDRNFDLILMYIKKSKSIVYECWRDRGPKTASWFNLDKYREKSEQVNWTILNVEPKK